jgi:hypothetical protein
MPRVADQGGREPVSVFITPEVANRARDCVYSTPGLTLARLVEVALKAEVYRRESVRGVRFPQRPTHRLRRGRPTADAARSAESANV